MAALTPDEKVRLVIGVGFYPTGFPAGMLPPGPPGGDKLPEKVPGTAYYSEDPVVTGSLGQWRGVERGRNVD